MFNGDPTVQASVANNADSSNTADLIIITPELMKAKDKVNLIVYSGQIEKLQKSLVHIEMVY